MPHLKGSRNELGQVICPIASNASCRTLGEQLLDASGAGAEPR